MEKINKTIKTLFWFSLGLSIGLPAGILCIVFGAINKIVVLLILGIALVAAGFYVMPILWVKYGERRQHRTILYMVLHDHIYTVQDLATQMGWEDEKMRQTVKSLIASRYLVGYLFNDDVLELNTNKQQTRSAKTRKCPNCGGPMEFDGVKFVCDYCDTVAE